MEYRVYKLAVTISQVENGMNYDTEIFNGLFASRKEAIKQAQKRFSRQPLNNYVNSVWAVVYPLIIADKGTTQGKRIYNLYKIL